MLTVDSFAARAGTLAALQQTHFWFAGRQRLVASLAAADLARGPQRVLDVGCGAGGTLQWLLDAGHGAVGLDLSPASLDHAARTVPRDALVPGDATALPFAGDTFDGLLLLDVLEHLDDAAALAEARRVVRPGGWIVVAVPAHRWLWSVRDIDAGHRRRYSRRGLVAAVTGAGLTVEHVTSYQLALLPVLALGRLATRRVGARRWRDCEDRVPVALNRALTVVAMLEAAIAARVGLPWGSSLVVRARRAA